MIADIQLQNFRSYKNDSFEFSPGVNIIVGPNASGKTNLLEAVLVTCSGSSYRAKDSELVNFNENWARLDSILNNGLKRTIKIKLEPLPSKIYELEEKTFKRLSMNNAIPIVLFEPDHLRILSGSPDKRREYLDNLLEQTEFNYGKLRRQYLKVLAQRNALLKQLQSNDKAQIFPWDIRLSQLGGQIVKSRTQLVEQLNKNINELYKDLSKTNTDIEIKYQSRWFQDVYESSLLKHLENSLELDKLRGFTGAGPHREDFIIKVNNHPAQDSASRGEVRTIILSLKITELKFISEVRDITPLLLLDDVFSELDGKRRHALIDYLEPYQTFITTTDADIVTRHFTKNANVIAINN
jgi:DNA replication and repair protein RecF